MHRASHANHRRVWRRWSGLIAHRDPLGLQPPIIKVQCKRSAAPISSPTVQALLGTLVPQRELGLFVTLGSYSKDTLHIARSGQDLRLLGGKDLVELILKHYDSFARKWKTVLPLRSVYVVDRSPET
jgi:restriction system protein